MKAKKTILKNGLRVITIPMKESPTVTALVLVGTGSKYETKEINGLSHFLEHMCFKGTLKRPTARDISTELDTMGAQYNAFTGQEYTGYYAKSDAKHFKKIFDVVSDVYLNSTFPEAEMEKEKGVIIEEINMYEDLPMRHVQDMIMELLYGDQPAGWNIAGPIENIKKMKRDDFVKYKKEQYVPKATTVVIAGGVSEKDMMIEVKKTFAHLKNDKKSGKLKTIEKQNKPVAKIKHKATDQTHFVLAFRALNVFDKKSAIASVMSGVLGAGMSSRLFHKLREEMGVCYYVRANTDPYTDHGVFQISSGVDNKRVKEVISAILVECEKLKNELVPEKELAKVKEMFTAGMKMGLEATDDVANFYGGQEIMVKKIESPEDKAKKIKAVTSKQIQAMAKQIFQNNKLNLALIGPFNDQKEFLPILKI
ncbi:MAG: pitrilysin family protein [Candidatus Nomurabacteria bacterium]|nr:pitrilysin family protein [Candidatus Nomurabacteria bacterium]